MNGKQLVNYGLTALVVYFAYKILAPILDWIVYLIPTVAVIMIILGCIRMYRGK